MIIVLYLVAIVLANLSVTWFGAGFVITNQVLFIGFDLIARDSLHERWKYKNLWRNMFGLIAAGGIVTVIVLADALPVALVSCTAFALTALTDTIIYQLLKDRPILARMNGSNLISAAVDSVVFVGLLWPNDPALLSIILTAYLSKVFGGAIWSLAFRYVPAVLGLRRA